eukprot:10443142-Alexandrium_andersonii.AAC.1
MRQWRGGRHRLRFARKGRKERGWGLWEIATAPAGQVIEHMGKLGVFPKLRIPHCSACAARGKRRRPEQHKRN